MDLTFNMQTISGHLW